MYVISHLRRLCLLPSVQGGHKCMIEIRDTFRGAEIETPKASRGKCMGTGCRPPHPTRRSVGRHKLPPRGPRRSPGRKWIGCIWRSSEHISGRQKRQNDQLHFDQLLDAWHISTLNRDKLGTGFRIYSGQFSVPNDLVFFSGQALEIRDCPEKSGTDGHLRSVGRYNEYQISGWVITNDDGCSVLAANWSAWSKGQRLIGAALYSTREPGELWQWLCHHDCTINIVPGLSIIISLHPPGGIAIRRVCLLVGWFVRSFVNTRRLARSRLARGHRFALRRP